MKASFLQVLIFKFRKMNQRISASIQGTPRRGNEQIAKGYALAGPSARSLNACVSYK